MGFRLAVTAIGMNTVRARLEALGKKVPATAGAALRRLAETVMTEAKRRAPVGHGRSDELQGVLRASGVVAQPVQDGQTVSVTLGFGDGPSAPYALAVHEHLSKHSPPSWQKAKGGVHFSPMNTGPKYLEGPFLEITGAGKLEQQVADDLLTEFEK